jgi:hypothetical protein
MSQPLLNVLRITFGESGPLMENIHSGDMSRSDIEQDVVLNCRTGGTYDIHYSMTPLSTLDGQNIGLYWLFRMSPSRARCCASSATAPLTMP